MENVIGTLFEVPSEAYQAFTELKTFPQNDDTRIAQAVLLKKDKGNFSVEDAFDPLTKATDDMLVGTLIGSVVGILGGPLGVLLGAGVGAWVGNVGGTEEALAQESLVEAVASRMENGDVAIVMLVQEKSEAPLDQFFGKFRTIVARWDAWRIQQEVVSALEVQADLQEKALADLRARRSQERKEKFEEFRQSLEKKFEELKARFQ